jgi:hypothetical protein
MVGGEKGYLSLVSKCKNHGLVKMEESKKVHWVKLNEIDKKIKK